MTATEHDEESRVEPVDFLDFTAARGPHLYRTAFLLTGGDTHQSQDLVQETLARLYARWGKYARLDHPGAYARTILTSVFLSQRRRRASTEQPAGIVPESAEHGDAGDPDLRVTLLDALRVLPERDRAVLVLRFWEDRSVEETGTMLSMSSGAVRTRTGRARERLRLVLGDSFAESTGF